MAVREIRKNGDEVLRKTCREVTEYNERLWTLLDDMRDTMEEAGGVGLAAPQVGILRRIAVIDIGEGLIELVNPRIVASDGEQEGPEGCLSIPGECGIVKRPMKVTVTAFDRLGKEFTMTGEEFLARAICHELDHLDGVLYIDTASRMLTPEEREEMLSADEEE